MAQAPAFYALKRRAGSPHERRRAVALAESFAFGDMWFNACSAFGDRVVASSWTYSLKTRLGDGTPVRPEPLPAFDLFATRIWQVELSELAGEFPAWVREAHALRRRSPEPAGRTNRGGWNSTSNAVLDAPGFAGLNDRIRRACRTALIEMGVAEPAFRLQSWFNIHDRGGFNFLHMHDNVMLSGCFYLSVPAGSGNLVFRDPRPGVLNSFIKGNGPNAHKDVQLKPRDGLLVLFPHWLEHYVEPHDANEARIAIPFNATAD